LPDSHELFRARARAFVESNEHLPKSHLSAYSLPDELTFASLPSLEPRENNFELRQGSCLMYSCRNRQHTKLASDCQESCKLREGILGHPKAVNERFMMYDMTKDIVKTPGCMIRRKILLNTMMYDKTKDIVKHQE
jgi:hypothetical protein